jgi:hypothetical protein
VNGVVAAALTGRLVKGGYAIKVGGGLAPTAKTVQLAGAIG